MVAELKQQRERILSVAASHGARNVRVFGSRLRGDGGPLSDLDLLVELEAGRTLLDHVALQQDLGELLSCRVDVVVEGGLSPHLGAGILSEARPL